MTKEFKSFKIVSYIELSAAAVFSLLLLHISADISIFAFPAAIIYTGILIFLTHFKLIQQNDGSKLFAVLKLTQYLPYALFVCFILRRAGKTGTSNIYDFITVVLWFVIFVTSLISSHQMGEKKLKKLCDGWKIKPEFKKPSGAARILFEIVDWIDALVWAIFTVLLVQIFIFQLYEIPSESMVPTFLIKDRVIVSKFDCGPKFPLTDIGLPDFRHYKRGDTIVLRNPHYTIDRKSEVKTVTSQLIYMLTFMTVNTNTDENGEMKYDPLVKRICGQPGEQLVMQDGQLYARTKAHDFEAVELDNKFATWNLAGLQPSVRQKVQTLALADVELNRDRSNYKDYVQSASDNYEAMLDFEEKRRNYDLSVAAFQSKELVNSVKRLCSADSEDFKTPDLFEFSLFRQAPEIAVSLLHSYSGLKWFESFMTSWIEHKNDEKDLYSESNFRLNVMSKITFGKLILRSLQLNKSGLKMDEWSKDDELMSFYSEAQTLNWYIQSLLDERNMPVFPANDEKGNPQFIPANCWFMMGDNRFNSLDLRHSNDQTLKPLSSYDSMSVQYYSMMEPQYVNKRYIIGKPVYRFWPASRRGKV